MAINIHHAKANPNSITVGTTGVTFTFDGVSDLDNDRVTVTLTLPASTSAKFVGGTNAGKQISADKIFNKTEANFSFPTQIIVASKPPAPQICIVPISGTNARGNSSGASVSITIS